MSASTSWAFRLSPARGWFSLVSSAFSFGTVSDITSSVDIRDDIAKWPLSLSVKAEDTDSFIYLRTREYTRNEGKIYGQG